MTTSTRLYLASAVGAAASFAVVALYLGGVLDTSVYLSDVPVYWQNSLELHAPFDPFHPPGYALWLALGRVLTFGLLSPLQVMWLVSFAFYLAGTLLVIECVRPHAGERAAAWSALCYLLWPFVGVTYVVYPIADSLVTFLVVLAVWLLLHGRIGWMWGVFAFAFLTHKAAWPFAGLLGLVAVVLYRRRLGWRLGWAGAVPLPLVGLWLWGMRHYGAADWMFARTVRADVLSRGPVPVLDGLFGTVLSGTTAGVLKGLVAWGVTLACFVILYRVWRGGSRELRLIGAAVALAVLFLVAVLNQNTIWGAVRFSKVLVIPIAWFSSSWLPESRRWNVALFVLVALALLVTQLGFAWHFATAFVPAV